MFSKIRTTVVKPFPNKGLLDDDFQIPGCTKSELLFTDIAYLLSFFETLHFRICHS